MNNLAADYLVIGTGAIAMSFVDTMLDESDATFLMVDKHHMPGGHWNDAYPFVRLHQPSAFYGVASTELGSNRIDEVGSNKGYYELASGAEVSAYFDRVMRERFLPSGRVQYYPMCEVTGDGEFRSLVSDTAYRVSVARKTVDGTFFNTTVPSTHTRKYDVDEGVECITPNELPRRAGQYRRFTVVGGGKTGMDTLVWLLESGVNPDAVTWICPRDSWLINRDTTQPGRRFAKQGASRFIAQLESIPGAESIDEVFERFEAAGVMLRIDTSVRPSMFHYATISIGEVEQLRRLKHVIRGSHVARIGDDGLEMSSGEHLAAEPDTLYIDCTATAVEFVGDKTVPVFTDDLITLQALVAPLVTTSAAIIAWVEAHVSDTEEQNRLCPPVPLADNPVEWMQSFVGNSLNQNTWSSNEALRDWYARCRLNPLRAMPDDVALNDEQAAAQKEAAAAMKSRIGAAFGPAMDGLQKLMAIESARTRG